LENNDDVLAFLAAVGFLFSVCCNFCFSAAGQQGKAPCLFIPPSLSLSLLLLTNLYAQNSICNHCPAGFPPPFFFFFSKGKEEEEEEENFCSSCCCGVSLLDTYKKESGA
jgi:hypothetical protein